MRSLIKPTQKAKTVFALCTGNIQDDELKAKLNAVADTIEAEEIRYDEHGENAELFQLSGTNGVGNDVSTEEMIWLYDNKLSKKGHAARKIYDEIRTSSKHGICPLCAHRDVSTLDHYLAKTIHPLYAITPINLLPACSPCNKTKLASQPDNAVDQTLHPYFDNVDHAQWLKAQVVEETPPGVLFFAEPPNDWPQVLRERVANHFKFFKLEELYAANAARELANICHYLRRVADDAGSEAVRSHLEVQATSRRVAEINSWETAMYEALAASEWFWNGGHRSIAV
jgi:hypothetical protein